MYAEEFEPAVRLLCALLLICDGKSPGSDRTFRQYAFKRIRPDCPSKVSPVLDAFRTILRTLVRKKFCPRRRGVQTFSEDVVELQEIKDAQALWPEGFFYILRTDQPLIFQLFFGEADPLARDSEGSAIKRCVSEIREIPLLDPREMKRISCEIQLNSFEQLLPVRLALMKFRIAWNESMINFCSVHYSLKIELKIDPGWEREVDWSPYADGTDTRIREARKKMYRDLRKKSIALNRAHRLLTRVHDIFRVLMQKSSLEEPADNEDFQSVTHFECLSLSEGSKNYLSNPLAAELDGKGLDPAVLQVQRNFEDLLQMFIFFACAKLTFDSYGGFFVNGDTEDTVTLPAICKNREEMSKRRITDLDLQAVANYLADHNVILPYLTDFRLHQSIVKEANALLRKSTRRRAGYQGIDLHTFLIILVHGVRNGMLVLPLMESDNPLIRLAAKNLSEEVDLNKLFIDLGLRQESELACQTQGVCTAWFQSADSEPVRIICGESDSLPALDSDSDAPEDEPSGSLPRPGSLDPNYTEFGRAQDPGAPCAGSPRGGGGLGSEADSDKWRFRRSRRMEQFFIPSLIVNQGNTCYIGCSLQVLVNI